MPSPPPWPPPPSRCPRTAGCPPSPSTAATNGAEVAELTDGVDLSGWPAGLRLIVRREDPHPGAQLTFTDVDGHRFQAFVTDLPEPDVAYLEALYRGRGR